ncbi:heme peroxidase, partial [Pseudomassariella vexata]
MRLAYWISSPDDDTLVGELSLLTLSDINTLQDFMSAEVNGEHNDSHMLVEHLIQVLCKLPQTSPRRKQLTDTFIRTIWNGLPHPPPRTFTYLSSYREPTLDIRSSYGVGSAGSQYSRMVPVGIRQGGLPDPGLIFDLLMARDGRKRDHPSKISSMLLYLAFIIKDDLFQTKPQDPNVNMTSSYLDLSPLYGRNATEQIAMRQFKEGLLKLDCFSSKEVLLLPPGVGVFLVMFNRFHNYVATQLAAINETGRFTAKPALNNALDPTAAEVKRDEDLFQTARLITCGLYVNIILKDYIRTSLNLNSTDSSWAPDPRIRENKNLFSPPIPHSTGNNVSLESSLIHHWHSCLSNRNAKWITGTLRGLLNGIHPADASIDETVDAMRSFSANITDAPEKRTFGTFKRLPDGKFSDDGLVEELNSSIEDVAGAFGANRVPSSLRATEILGIMQARQWHVATLNEYRAFVGLSQHETFEDINPDPKVADNLRALYRHPDQVELYPGVVVEKTKPVMAPGSGLSAGFTASRAILCDVVSLVRGDGFYMDGWNHANVTSWGFNEVTSDDEVNHGCVMHKLILRAFPKHFEPNSIYAHFPFVVPEENRNILAQLDKDVNYSFNPPKRQPETVVVNSAPKAQGLLTTAI